MALRNLYALMIGIDKYQHVTNLGGCKADINKVKEYFSTLAAGQFAFQAMTLFDEQATRAGILKAYQEHLIDQAEEGDIALLYYSGHGAQEAANEIFWESDPNKKLEGLVCHDSGKGAAPLIADKEQRYLIHQLSLKGCEILTIFDSCHSADNTRSSQPPILKPQRRIAAVMPERKWDEFIFFHLFTEDDLRRGNVEDLLPQGRHVQLAACQDFEFAYENENGGMFTDGLLKSLKESSGKISYVDLLSKVKYAIKGADDGISQSPQSYYTFGHEEDIFKEFLSGVVRDRPLYANIVYNAQRDEWIMDKGSMHGVGRVIKGQEPVVMIPIAGGKNVSAYIQSTLGASSVLDIEPAIVEDFLDKTKSYQGIVKGLLVEPLFLYVAGDGEGVEALKSYVKANDGKWQDLSLYLVENESEATFQILAHGKEGAAKAHYAITELGSSVPLMQQSMGYDDSSIGDLEAKLQKLSRWYFAKELKNPEPSTLGDEPIRMTVTSAGKDHQPIDGIIDLVYDDPSAPIPQTKAKFAFTNTLDEDLYMAALYMDRDLSMMNNAIQQRVVRLKSGDSAYFGGGRPLPLRWMDEKEQDLIDYGVAYDYFFVKIIASTQEFTVDLFSQKGVPRAFTKQELRGVRHINSRSLFMDDMEEPEGEEWTTQLYMIRTPNPRL